MFRYILFFLLLASPGWAQSWWGSISGNLGGIGGNTSPIQGIAQQPAAALQTLSAAPWAPRRHKLTQGFGAIDPTFSNPMYSTLSTYVAIMPLETTPYALRILTADPYSTGMQIVSAAAYPSDSYAGIPYIGPTWDPSGTINTTVFPTANSVYATCTATNANTTVTCPNTALFPNSATMYVLGVGMPVNVSATIATGTTITLSANYTGTTGPVNIQVANKATAYQLYFDNLGSDVDTINTSGTRTSLTVAGNPASPNNNPQAFALQLSDFVPFTTVARADGGTQPLVFVYITMGPSTTAFGRNLAGDPSFNASVAPSYGNRFLYQGVAWNGNTDWSNNSTGSGFKQQGTGPVLGLQYLTDNPGIQIAQTGDSLSTAPSADGISNIAFRGCMTISTPTAPCAHVNFAWGGTAFAVYGEALRRNIGIIDPSVVILQPDSRNDGLTVANLTTLYGQNLSYWAGQVKHFQGRLGFYGPWPLTTSLDGSPTIQAAIQAVKNRMLAINVGCAPSGPGNVCASIPTFDPTNLVSRAALGGNAWDYLALNSSANGAVAAGGTSIAVQTASVDGVTPATSPVNLCYVGDILLDTTNPAVIAGGSTVSAVTPTTLTVSSAAIIGAGISNLDTLVCKAPGYGGSVGFTNDNTHPNYAAMAITQSIGLTWFKKLVGFQ
jgi:hypothetical protein